MRCSSLSLLPFTRAYLASWLFLGCTHPICCCQKKWPWYSLKVCCLLWQWQLSLYSKWPKWKSKTSFASYNFRISKLVSMCNFQQPFESKVYLTHTSVLISSYGTTTLKGAHQGFGSQSSHTRRTDNHWHHVCSPEGSVCRKGKDRSLQTRARKQTLYTCLCIHFTDTNAHSGESKLLRVPNRKLAKERTISQVMEWVEVAYLTVGQTTHWNILCRTRCSYSCSQTGNVHRLHTKAGNCPVPIAVQSNRLSSNREKKPLRLYAILWYV